MSISAAVSSPTASFNALRSTLPRLSLFTLMISKPHIAALAGFVPCALSGTIILLRFESPLDKWYFLITCKLVYSPCAPAAGSRDISSIPVISARDFAASYMTSSEPCTVDAGCSGCTEVNAGFLASTSLSFGLYFIVQLPSG